MYTFRKSVIPAWRHGKRCLENKQQYLPWQPISKMLDKTDFQVSLIDSISKIECHWIGIMGLF